MTTHEPIIISVPHSGTRFLKERLGLTHQIHTNLNWERLIERIEGRPLIAPLRNPVKVWRSWCRRRHGDAPFPHLAFTASWCMMHTLDMLYEIDFIDIETQSDPRIKDWRPVGDKDHTPSDWKLVKNPDIRLLYKLPFVRRHYTYNEKEQR